MLVPTQVSLIDDNSTTLSNMCQGTWRDNRSRAVNTNIHGVRTRKTPHISYARSSSDQTLLFGSPFGSLTKYE